ncbi:DUF3987 domain-containing protein [Deinococcus detaillensis]|uniref:DUF3987 domain-containing protein n=1 Tax=Deinococcus detaillensis TaxID=2592048 RepID=A0A553V617_9DEIO|nr:DUF3987 domain-containing protein [Deinococcus detaillensis]TSA87902.1 DUF3987 domain-containing protein [Deinococcus detaillensis]
MDTLPSEATALLAQLDGRSTFQTFDDRPVKNRRLSRILHDPAELQALNRQGAGVFVMVNEGDGEGRAIANVTRIRTYCADFDGQPLPERWPLAPSMLNESSLGKFHAYWILEDAESVPLDNNAFNVQQEAIARAVGSCPDDCKGLNRVMRLPGFLHQKGESFTSRIVSCTGERFTLAQIQAAFPLPAKLPIPLAQQPTHSPLTGKPSTQREAQQKYALITLHGLADELAQQQEPGRNNRLNAVGFRAGRLIGGGHLARGEVERELLNAATLTGLLESEVSPTLHSALTAGMADPEMLEDVGQMAGKVKDLHNSPSGLEWKPRQLLPPKLPPVPTMPPDMVPEALRGWLVNAAELACIPLELFAVLAVASISGLVGRSIKIKPERLQGWAVVPNLWAAIVGRPGAMKSMILDTALEFLQRLERQAAEAHEAQLLEVEIEREALLAEAARLKKQAAKSGGFDREALRDLKEREKENVAVAKRYVTQNVTYEKLGELIQENKRGLTFTRDELGSWINDLTREERAEALGFFLTAWNGEGMYSFERIGRGTVRADNPCISVIGGIQPGPLTSFMVRSRAGSAGDSGLLQRFQLIVWPDSMGEWIRQNRRASSEDKARAFSVFEALDSLYLPGEDEPPSLPFSDEAQPMWEEWRDALENRLRGGEVEHAPAFESHVSKYRSLAPSLALVFHVVELAAPDMDANQLPPVSVEALELALNWVEFLELHARKVYALELGTSNAPAYMLAEKIKAKAVKDGDRLRDLRRKDWAGLTDGLLDRAIEQLAALGWVQVEEIETGGRSSEVLRLHPDLIGGDA